VTGFSERDHCVLGHEFDRAQSLALLKQMVPGSTGLKYDQIWF